MLALSSLIRKRLPSAIDFADISSQCLGAYPAAVHEALQAITASDDELAEAAQLILNSVQKKRSRNPYWDRRLPLPHPLDDDWRFSPRTADALLELGLEAAGPKGRLLLVAVPTLAMHVLDRSLGNRVVFAARLDDPVTDAISKLGAGRISIREIRNTLSDLECDAAICDPPWSDGVARAVVRAAVSGVKESRPVLVCIPDELTGASQADLLSGLPDQSAEFGLSSASVTSFPVRYETPLFEVNALIAAGIHNFDPDWRTGRLVRGFALGTIELAEFPRPEWAQDAVGTMRLFSRSRAGAAGRRTCFKAVPSISRTHPRRANAVGWTSGNRATETGAQTKIPLRKSSRPRWLVQLAATENIDAETLLRLDPY